MNELFNTKWDLLSALIDKAQNILLSTHINADGDGVGSQVAFYYYLKDIVCYLVIMINATQHFMFLLTLNVIPKMKIN